jgi:UPF0042 nucleotide-binding protein
VTQPVRLVLITGLSGSGKSSVAKCLEDLGYFCIDNLPATLLRPLLQEPRAHIPNGRRIAVVADTRNPNLIQELPEMLRQIDRSLIDPLVLFLEASDEILVRRFSETRRRHPLAPDGPVLDGISREREALAELRGMADRVWNSTEWTIHEIRAEVYRELSPEDLEHAGLTVTLVSFGFKRGLPLGSDLVFDVRYLPNPYFVPELKEQTGLDQPILDYLDASEEFGALTTRLGELLDFLLPRFKQENRSYLTVAIGCTGGRHRSVAVVERLADRLAKERWPVRVLHRDIKR